MNVYLEEREVLIVRNYIEEMLALFEEKDVINKGDRIYSMDYKIAFSKEDFLKLKEKFF